ncbi:MAG TPA: hypothetical protein VGW35_12425 [Methylomirabilota bacterium]|jgi:hypothetical protein|nr:hypothetical protein [Methylomirabilota bacterium]
MRRVGFVVMTALVWAAWVSPAHAYSCPILIKEADDAIARAEAVIAKASSGEGRAAAERALAEAKRMVAEARRDHEGAKAKAGHAVAVRKAKIARAFAEEAQVLAE